jgi:hypothetical protein
MLYDLFSKVVVFDIGEPAASQLQASPLSSNAKPFLHLTPRARDARKTAPKAPSSFRLKHDFYQVA